jgi:triosephosphate isomerase
MSRRLLIAGNWKMNKAPGEADALARELKTALLDCTHVDLAVAPTSLTIAEVGARLKHTGIQVGAQDLHAEVSGAYTGAIAGEMLRAAGCTFVLCGHSERRSVFGDTDEMVNAKVLAAMRAGLQPYLCVGESLAERDAGQAQAVVERQLTIGLAGLEADQVASLVLAYEPVWAIGTGRTATPETAQDIHAFIRAWLTDNYPSYVAAQTRILYGGSVKPGNAAELLGQADIDGALVGGASLKAESFKGIAQAV